METPRPATTERLSATAVRWRCLEFYVNGRRRVPVRARTAPAPRPRLHPHPHRTHTAPPPRRHPRPHPHGAAPRPHRARTTDSSSSFWRPHRPGCCGVRNGAPGFSAQPWMDTRVPASLGRLHARLMGAPVSGLCVDGDLRFSWVNTWGRAARSYGRDTLHFLRSCPTVLRVVAVSPCPTCSARGRSGGL